jgi:hypothetical protein
MKYKQDLVEKVQQKKLAVHNINCTKQELIDLLTYIFPEDHYASGDSVYYYGSNIDRWQPTDFKPNFPSLSVKEFLEEEFVLPNELVNEVENKITKLCKK